MFNDKDKVIFEYMKEFYQGQSCNDMLKGFLGMFDGKKVRGLSGKEYEVEFSDRYGDYRIEAKTESESFDILGALSEFELFCETFPYDKKIKYVNLKDLFQSDIVFVGGAMSPRRVLGEVTDRTFQVMDLFYGLVLSAPIF